MNKPFVSVKTITYNHEEYIARCIEGIVNQKTNFSFEYIIGEDCSTDDTLKIVQEYADKYPDIIRVITSESNVGACENDHRTDMACRGKYVAFCEGDDFWTDPHKLQKQVDFLETHPEYGLVHTNFSCITEDKLLERIHDSRKIPTGDILQHLIKGNHIATASVCMRNDLLQAIRIGETVKRNNWKMGDYPLWIEAAARFKVHYMPDDTMTYRIHSTSATHGLDMKGDYRFFKDRYRIKRYYIEKFYCYELTPFINRMYYRELLKYAIFLKDEKMRKECCNFFKMNMDGSLLYFILSQFKVFDSLFCFLYSSRKKMKTLV